MKKHKINKSKKSKKQKQRPPHVPIYKPTMDRFLKEDEPVGLIALENFYYYTCNWQKNADGHQGTNRCHAVIAYAAKGLKVSPALIRRWKHRLIALGRIRDIVVRDKKTNRITGHYIEVIHWKPSGCLKATLTFCHRVEKML